MSHRTRSPPTTPPSEECDAQNEDEEEEDDDEEEEGFGDAEEQESPPPVAPLDKCPHCGKAVPAANMLMHRRWCEAHHQKCPTCGEFIDRDAMDRHHALVHALVKCGECEAEVEPQALGNHQLHLCPQRAITCKYCKARMRACEQAAHQELCGNSLLSCEICAARVLGKQMNNHLAAVHRIDPCAPPEVRARSLSTSLCPAPSAALAARAPTPPLVAASGASPPESTTPYPCPNCGAVLEHGILALQRHILACPALATLADASSP